VASADQSTGLAAPALAQPSAGRRRRHAAWPVLPALLLAPILIFGAFGPWIAPHSITDFDFLNSMRPPAWLAEGDPQHLLGTDQHGRDVLSLIIMGARFSLLAAFVGVAAAGLLGTALGTVSGYFGGAMGFFIMRVVDLQMSIPAVLFGILVGAALGPGFASVVIAVAATFWPLYARVTRAEALALRNRGFVELAEVAGCGRAWILRRHVLPHLLNTVLVLGALQFGLAIILESGLTFLGLGIQAPQTAWGLLIADGRAHLETAWWISTFPGLLIVAAALGANLLSDWLQTRLDPRLRSARG